MGLCRAALDKVVRFLTTNMEEVGRVRAAGMTVFGVVACNRFEVTGAELLTPHPKKQLQHGCITDLNK